MSGSDSAVFMTCWWPVYNERTGEMCKYVYILHNNDVYFVATSRNIENKGRLFNVKDSGGGSCNHSHVNITALLRQQIVGGCRLLKARINLITGEVHAS